MTTKESPVTISDRLRAIEALTDSALSRLGADDFLSTLVERTKDILQADTAAVLLLEGGALVATAASGLEEEVRQGVRIPVGKGFAGRIAAVRKPVILDHVDHTSVLNPILLAKGIKSLMGVPLLAGGAIVGVMHVGSQSTRRFTSEDAALLQVAADRAAIAVHSTLMRDERVAAAALQRSLMPTALPAVPGIEISARYVTGQGAVGGDWYDVFVLPTGALGIVIGDVAGSGLPAAVIMGRMRSALRAYALEYTDPAEVIGRLDRKMQHFEPGAFATVQYAIFDQDTDLVHVSSAGHPPPVLASPGQPTVLAEVVPDLMIGVTLPNSRHTVTVPLPPGSMLCFYTDGLVERPDRPLDDGLDLLCAALAPTGADQACAAIMAALVGNEQARDDIALVAVRRL